MVDIPSIAAAMTSLKTAADIAKGMLDLKAGADARGVVIDLQSVILNAQSSALAAQSEQMTLLQRVAELEKRSVSRGSLGIGKTAISTARLRESAIRL